MAKGGVALKVIGYSCLIIVITAVIIGAVVLIVRATRKTNTDDYGNIWQKYEGSKSKPTFSVFAEEGPKDAGKNAIGDNAYIYTICDPMDDSPTTSLQYLTGDYAKGIARPNHCAVENAGLGQNIGKNDLDYYLLLPDGSLISMDGSMIGKIQVNINQDGTTIVQADGKAYYRIQKQESGKKFVIRVGDQTFTATGTEVDIDIGEMNVAAGEKNVQVMVINGSLESASTKKGGSAFTIKHRQKAKYPIRWQSSYPPTITPMDVEATDPLLTDKFLRKQTIFSYINKFSWQGQTLAQLTQTLQQVITAINTANQQVYDATAAEARGAYWDSFIKLWNEDDDASQGGTNNGSGSSSGGSQSGCPPSNIPTPDTCYKSSEKNGQYWCDSGNLSGWWKTGCVGGARLVN